MYQRQVEEISLTANKRVRRRAGSCRISMSRQKKEEEKRKFDFTYVTSSIFVLVLYRIFLKKELCRMLIKFGLVLHFV